jgi:hypothetical protein
MGSANCCKGPQTSKCVFKLIGKVISENKTVELSLDSTNGKYLHNFWLELTRIFELKGLNIENDQIHGDEWPILDV